MNKEILKNTIEDLYQDILINLDTTKIDHYFDSNYIQTTDHSTSNIKAFADHLDKLKEIVIKLSIDTFKTMMIDEDKNKVFQCYEVDVENKDGFIGKIEVYAEFSFNEEGKVITCNELTRPYNENLNGIGSIK